MSKRIIFSKVKGNFDLHYFAHPKKQKDQVLFGILRHSNPLKLFEIQKSGDNRTGSWIIENEIIQDGSFVIITEFDPTFLLIPLLQLVNKRSDEKPKGLFVQYEAIFDSFPILKTIVTESDVCNLCDVNSELLKDDGIKLYRLCDDKVLEWMEKKFLNIKTCLENNPTFMKSLDLSTKNFISSLEEMENQNLDRSVQIESINFLKEYISDFYVRKFSIKMNLENEIFPVVKLMESKKKKKFDERSVDEYVPKITPIKRKLTRKDEGGKKKKRKKQSAISMGASSLEKIDHKKMGLRKITSFFKKKKKKKSDKDI